MDNVAFPHQELLRLGTYCFDYRFGKELLFVESLNAFVEIDGGCTGGELG